MALKRFEHFPAIIARVQPHTIVEIGVHKGARTQLMIHEAMKHREQVLYVGYDIFEGGDMAFQKAAWNAKGIATEAEARAMLGKLSKIYGQRLAWDLVVGDTRKTLRGKHVTADLVFIDGDHRVETIRSDYEAVKRSRCVIFDDYYVPDASGQMPDVSSYGANRLVDELAAAVFPNADPCRPCGMVKIAMIEYGADLYPDAAS